MLRATHSWLRYFKWLEVQQEGVHGFGVQAGHVHLQYRGHLLPLVVTIISLVSSLKRSPSPLSSRPKRSSRSLGPPSPCLPAPHFLRLSRWSTGYCRLFPHSRCCGSSSSCLPPPLCPPSPDLATQEESHLHCSRWPLFQEEGPPASQTRLEGEERDLGWGGRGKGWGGYST